MFFELKSKRRYVMDTKKQTLERLEYLKEQVQARPLFWYERGDYRGFANQWVFPHDVGIFPDGMCYAGSLFVVVSTVNSDEESDYTERSKTILTVRDEHRHQPWYLCGWFDLIANEMGVSRAEQTEMIEFALQNKRFQRSESDAACAIKLLQRELTEEEIFRQELSRRYRV